MEGRGFHLGRAGWGFCPLPVPLSFSKLHPRSSLPSKDTQLSPSEVPVAQVCWLGSYVCCFPPHLGPQADPQVSVGVGAFPIFATNSKSLQGSEPTPWAAPGLPPRWIVCSARAPTLQDTPPFLPAQCADSPLGQGPSVHPRYLSQGLHPAQPKGAAPYRLGLGQCKTRATGRPGTTPHVVPGGPLGICACSLPAEIIHSTNPPKSLHYFFVNRAFPSQNNQHFSVAPTSGFDWPQPRGVDAAALTLW